MKQWLQQIKASKTGMSLSTTIALGFGGAVLVIFLIGVVVYMVKR